MANVRVATILLLACLAGCTSTGDDPVDAEDGAFTGGKADGFCVDPGSAEAAGILAFVNSDGTTLEELDAAAPNGAGLNRLAAQSIVQRRPFADLEALDAAPYVGLFACTTLRKYACDVKGLCDGGGAECDPDAFTSAPPKTDFTLGCLESLIALERGGSSDPRFVEVDVANRCEQLTEIERLGFDYTASEYGIEPQSWADEGSEMLLDSEKRLVDRATYDIITIDDSSGLQAKVTFRNGQLLATTSDDGLSEAGEWYCGGDGPSIVEPDGPCLISFFKEGCASMTDSTRTVRADAGMPDLTRKEAFALLQYRTARGLAGTEDVELTVSACDARGVITVASAGKPSATYHMSEDDYGVWILAASDAGGDLQVVCEHDEW